MINVKKGGQLLPIRAIEEVFVGMAFDLSTDN